MKRKTKQGRKAKFKVGQVVRVLSIIDIKWPCYRRVKEYLGEGNYLTESMALAECLEHFDSEKYMRPLTKHEAGR